ncbi:MAG: hypothetical protein U9P38_06980 [Campylobacterota bacterium]|nr:hypothetical protein [Campylobacterota bacterium]
MAITTKHRYINEYPIKKTDKHLILGTIHPDKTNEELDFFYGNARTFWDLLSNATNLKFDTLDNITTTLSSNNIAISDMILECERANESVTKDSELFNLKLNDEIKNQILDSDIETIFFTSSFNKNNAAKLFFDRFNLKTQIPEDWKNNYEFDIVIEAKKIKCVILISPSGSANIGISKSKLYNKYIDKYSQFKTPVKQFKIDFYKYKFSSVFN